MKRVWAILFFAAGTVCPIFAAGGVTVAQLQQVLEAAQGKSDGKVAKEIGGLELTERVSSIRLAQWKAEFPGAHTREVLTQLADASAFLDPPAAESVSAPAPAFEEQKQLLDKAIDYAGQALSKLPNFYATRETTSFEDTPPLQSLVPVGGGGARFGSRMASMGYSALSPSRYEPLHKTGVHSEQVSYRDGHEVGGAGDRKSRGPRVTGLTTKGEFGPLLFFVLRDSVKGKLTWGHWEQGGQGLVAVFAYSVPQADSHYTVEVPMAEGWKQVTPAYHGEISIDRVTGIILRVTMIADMAPAYQSVHASMLVDYAPIAIGERIYTCPVDGVALSKMPVDVSDLGLRNGPVQTRLNEIVFKDYHLFRGDARILLDAGSETNPAPAASSSGSGALAGSSN
ncbi:MAG TPA: hypothetical protein VGG26_08595 [Terracidiphilus sp.]|jgi:hypothetical protein